MDRLTEQQERDLIEYTLQCARGPMSKWLGTRTRGYNAADEIAEGIARGIRRGLDELGLRTEPEEDREARAARNIASGKVRGGPDG